MLDCVCKHEEGENRNELPGTDTGPASHGMCSGVDVSVDKLREFTTKSGNKPKNFKGGNPP